MCITETSKTSISKRHKCKNLTISCCLMISDVVDTGRERTDGDMCCGLRMLLDRSRMIIDIYPADKMNFEAWAPRSMNISQCPYEICALTIGMRKKT